MTDLPQTGDRIARASHPDEETRYRAVSALDPALPGERAALLERLGDPSWRVRSMAVERLAALDDPAPVLAPLFARLVGGGEIGEREAAAAALARVGSAALPGLVERLGGDDPALRQAAAGVLGGIGDRRALPALAARLADADGNVRAAAADALGRIGGAEASAALLAAADSDDVSLRVTALQALAALRVAPPLGQLARLTEDRSSRRAAYRLLGFSDEPGALALLAGGVVDPARSVREAALAALGALRARRTLDDLHPLATALRRASVADAGLADRVEASLTSEEPFTPVGAATALGWIGGARQAGALARLAEDDRYRPLVEETLEVLPQTLQIQAALFDVLPSLSPMALVTVLKALARAGNEAAFRLLAARVADPEAQVRAEAVNALGRIGDARAVEALAAVLGDEDASVAVMAAAAVVRLGHQDEPRRGAVLAECRQRLLVAPSPAVLRVVGALGGAADVGAVRTCLAAPDPRIRAAAAAAVAALGVRGALREQDVPELAAALGDGAWTVRAAATRALADLARFDAERGLGARRGEHPVCRQSREALRAALHDAEPMVQAGAAEALGACGRTEYAPALEERVADPLAATVVVLAALRGLAALGALSPAAVARGIAHGDPEVVKEAVAAAGRLAGPEGAALLREAAESERWDVRHAVARAVAERGRPDLAGFAREQAARDGDPLVAKAFAAAAEALGARG